MFNEYQVGPQKKKKKEVQILRKTIVKMRIFFFIVYNIQNTILFNVNFIKLCKN